MGQYVKITQGLVLDEANNVVEFKAAGTRIRLLTAEQVLQKLGYSHVRHIYWMVEKKHLPYRKFGRELMFTETDIQEFLARRGQR